MSGFRAWKQSQRQHWNNLNLKQQSGWLTGMIALGTTMTVVAATNPIPAFWQGLMTGIWGSGTAALIVWLVAIQVASRRG